jgi:iron complex outermembrane recepter protein
MTYRRSIRTTFWSALCVSAVGYTPLSAQGASSDVQSLQLEEIIVTAQRREETSQKVPVAVAAFSEDWLRDAGISSNEQLSLLAPSLVYQSTAAGGAPFLRGVGTTFTGAPTEPPVGMYLDGFYNPTFESALMNFANVERVEVLRGPQGTLFGRNTTGGVVQVITKTPSKEPNVFLELGYANYEKKTASFYGSAGVGPIAADLSVYYVEHDGYGRNLTNGLETNFNEQYAVRSKWLWEITETTKATLVFDFSHQESDIGNSFNVKSGEIDALGRPRRGSIYDAFFSYDLSNGRGADSTTESSGAGLNITHEFDFASLVSMTSYRLTETSYFADIDASEFDLANVFVDTGDNADMITQELQLVSAPSSPFSWIAGAYYMNSTGTAAPFDIYGPVFAGPPLGGGFRINAEATTESMAVFGQATVPVADRLRATAGLRHTWDEQTIEGSQMAFAGFPLIAPLEQSEQWSEFTWRLALDYDVTDNVLAYVSYNRGYKSGAFSFTALAEPPVDPEELDAYEVGLKSDLLDKRLRFNINAYYYDYKDIQVEAIVDGLPGTFNAAAATVVGVETDIAFAVTQGLTLTAAGAWMPKAEYDQFVGASLAVPLPDGGNADGFGDASGNRMIFTPHFAGNVGANLKQQIGIGELTFSANYAYNRGFFFDFGNYQPHDEFSVLNARVSLQLADSGFEVAIFGNNLLEEEYYSNVIAYPFATSGAPGAPQTYGATVSFRFQ